MVQWLARLPGTQEIRGSSPGRGMTDFCTSIFICLYIYIYIYMYIYIHTHNKKDVEGHRRQGTEN